MVAYPGTMVEGSRRHHEIQIERQTWELKQELLHLEKKKKEKDLRRARKIQNKTNMRN